MIAEWEFKKVLSNAERMIEQRLWGWTYGYNDQVSCRVNVGYIVDMVVKSIPEPEQYRCPKIMGTGELQADHEVFDSSLVIKMRELQPAYTLLRLLLTKEWDEYYT